MFRLFRFFYIFLGVDVFEGVALFLVFRRFIVMFVLNGV